MTDDDLRRTIEEAYDYSEALSDESDRGAAILAAAEFENWLRDRIKSQLAELGSELDDRIFGDYGLLSSFSSKIYIACALQLYDEDTRKSLHKIRKIRNKFAHTAMPLEFRDEEVSKLCRELLADATSDSQDLRKVYMNFLSQAKNVVRSSLFPLRL